MNPFGLAARRLCWVSSGALLIAGCDLAVPARTQPPSAASSRAAAAEIVTPERRTIRLIVEQPGQVEADEATPLHAKLSGYVESVAVDIGDHVKAGQVLARLAVPELQAEAAQKAAAIIQADAVVRQAKAAIKVAHALQASAAAKTEAARAHIKHAQADLARFRSEFDRTEQLVRDRSVPATRLDEATSNLRRAEADLDSTRADVHTAEAAEVEAEALREKAEADLGAAEAGRKVADAAADEARAFLEYATIVAPFHGVVTRRRIDPGYLTIAGPQGEPLFVVQRVDPLIVAVNVPESRAANVRIGATAKVKLQSGSAAAIEGRVVRTAGALDPATQTLRVEVVMDQGGAPLLPGKYAVVGIVLEEHADVLAIPTSAILRDGGATFCAAVVDGKVTRTQVELGVDDGAWAELKSGLTAEDKFIKTNPGSFANGQKVEATPPPAASGKLKGL